MTLIQAMGGRFSKELVIGTKSKESLNKWGLASIFGTRIGEKIAINTYREFEKNNVTSFEVVLLRLAKNYCNKNKCPICPVKEFCIKYEE